MVHPLSGMYAALLTGFTDQGEFDETRQKNIINYVIKQGLKGLYVGGSTAEAGLMDVDELIAQQAIVKQHVRDEHILMAHVGAPNIRDSIKLAKNAKNLSYDALSALPPHSYPFSEAEVFAYYKALADATDLPLIVYEVPFRSGRDSSLEELGNLLDLPNVAGIKFSSSDMFKFSQLRMHHPNKVLYFGFDEFYSAGALLGADGGIGSTYNVFGRLYVALNQAIISSDVKRAQELQSISVEFVTHLMGTGVMPGTKLALEKCGVDCGPSRKPFTIKCSNAAKALEDFMKKPKVKEWLAV